jgi:hypothetical protein
VICDGKKQVEGRRCSKVLTNAELDEKEEGQRGRKRARERDENMIVNCTGPILSFPTTVSIVGTCN